MRSRFGRWSVVTVIVALALALAACSTADEDEVVLPDLEAVPELAVREVARVPDMATSALVVGDDLLVTGREGRIFTLPLDDGSLPDGARPELPAALDLRDRTSLDGERGMFDVEPVSDDLLAISRTGLEGEVLVELVTVGPDRTLAMAERGPVLEIPHDATFHNGGALVADGDDLLMSLGDNEQVEGDPAPAQDPDDPLGSIVRIPADQLDPAGGGPFEPTADDLIAIGLRNPYRMNLDAETDSLWIGEVGAGTVESVEVLRREDGEWTQENFGWPIYEGQYEFRAGETLEGTTFPVFEREHADDVCAIIGGYVYRGEAIPELDGAYVYGDYCSTEVRAVLVTDDDEVLDDTAIATVPEPLVSITPGPDGEILALGAYGGVYAIGLSSSGSAASSASPTVDLTDDDLCRMQGAFLGLAETGTLDAEGLRERFVAALEAARPLAATGDRSATQILEAFQWAVATGEAAGWDPADPAVQGIMATLTSGDGELAYVKVASAELLGRAPSEC